MLHVAGTNGKSSVTRMTDALLAETGLRTGRYTSPHLQLAIERIALDGAPISPRRYVEVYRDIAPYVEMVDGRFDVPLSKFEVLTAMAFAAFADAPVEAAAVEVGLGGRWDATNVADGAVSVVTPIGIDHVDYLGADIAGIAAEKAGIIKPDSIAVLAGQPAEVDDVLAARCAELGVTVARQGKEFGVLDREIAVGGQLLRLQGLGGVYDEVFLPLHGEHQAGNAALALAAVEAFLGAAGDRQLDVNGVRASFAHLVVPGRLERVRAAPAVLVDAAHNPHGMRALADALRGEFAFARLVAVLGVMRDKDARGMLAELEPVVHEVVVTANSSPRSADAGRACGGGRRGLRRGPGDRRAAPRAGDRGRGGAGRGGRRERRRRGDHRIGGDRGRGARAVRQAARMTAPDLERGLRGVFAATLVLEAVAVLLALLVITRVGEGTGPLGVSIVLALAGALLVAAGLQRRPWGLGARACPAARGDRVLAADPGTRCGRAGLRAGLARPAADAPRHPQAAGRAGRRGTVRAWQCVLA